MNKWKVVEVEVGEIEGTEVNANQMTKKNFDKLVENIRKSGLSSMIACYKRTEDGKYVIISGNHRYKACVKLGYSKINILCANEEELTRDEIIAVQLSHNSLHGSDDKGILKRLFDEIDNIDYKDFAHISMDDLKIEDDMFSGSIVPVSEHFRVALVLYKNDIELLEELLDIVHDDMKTQDMVILANSDECEDELVDAISLARKEFDIKSSSIAFSKILRLAKEAMGTKGTESNKKE